MYNQYFMPFSPLKCKSLRKTVKPPQPTPLGSRHP
jgi:hypothetical protein